MGIDGNSWESMGSFDKNHKDGAHLMNPAEFAGTKPATMKSG